MRRFYQFLSGIAIATVLTTSVVAQNVGISNTAITPDAQAIMELRATDKGVLLPRMTTAQATSLSASLDAADDGMTVYDTDENRYKYWDGSTLTWRTIASGTATTGDFIMNGTTQQTGADFNIDGDGTMGDLNLTGNDIVSNGILRIASTTDVRIRLDSDGNGSEEFQITNNGGTTPVFSVTEGGNVRATSLGGSGNAVMTTDNTGLMSKTALTGNTNDVYNGAGAFVDATTLTVTGDNLGNHVATTTVNTNGNDIDMVRGDVSEIRSVGSISFDWTAGTYDSPSNHGIRSYNENGVLNDDLSINSFDNIINRIDANNNNSTSYFKVEHHSTGNGTDLFWVRSPDGDAYHSGDLGIGTTNATGDLHVFRGDADIARVYATGTTQGSGMFYAGQSNTYGGGFVYDGDGTPALVGGTDRVTFFRRNNGTDTDVMSYAYSGNTVRMTALAGGAGGVVTANNAGDIGRTTYTGNANHVLNGTGAFVDASTLSVSGDNLGNHVATTNLNMNNREIDNVTQVDITAGNGNGMRFWSSNSYAINMGNASEFQYGYVNDYSIKTNMSNTAGRGWTWGVDGLTPVASIEAQSGSMTLRGNLHVSQGNTTGNGIILADDGGIYDRNDGYGSLAFSAGVDMEDAQDVTDHLQVRFNDSYPEIWSYRNNGTTLTEFRTGIYNNGGTFYSQNQMYARAGIANDQGTLTFNDNIRITGGGPAAGRVLQSDATGNATWVEPTTLNVTGDNLGNHTATTSLKRTGHNIGHLEGSYNSVAPNSSFSNPIYTIGSAYNPAVSSLSNMYGIGYSHANFWGTGGNRPGGWGMYAAADGDIRVILDASNGIVWSEGVMRTNGGYQVDGLTVIDDGGGWHRSYGNTGWYNGTHGGGFYMTDATWIRTYNNKSFYHNAGTMRTDGTFHVGSGGATLNVPNNGNFAYRSNVLFANTAGNVGVGTNSPGQKLDVNGNIHLGSSTGNKQIYTWSATDANWRIGMSASPGFTRNLLSQHVQYMTYAPGTTQGFAVGVNGGNSSFEVRGSDHAAYFRGRIGVNANPNGNDWQYVNRPGTETGANKSNVYGYRAGTGGATNGGNGYGVTNMDLGLKGYSYWGNNYASGIGGFCFLDYDRSSGVHGAKYNGAVWGALGYQAVGGGEYGLYYTNFASGTGYAPEGGIRKGIGAGGVGDLLGSWTRGDVMGHIAAGEAFASYNLGDEYTSGRQIELIETESGKQQAFTVTSTESKIYENGVSNLNGGSGVVQFPSELKSLIKDGTPTVTVTPMGMCNGLYLESVSEEGFVVRELNNGNSTVQFSWIVVAERIDSKKQQPIVNVLDRSFDANLMSVMGNQNDPNLVAKPMWWDGTQIRFDQLPAEKDAKH